MISNKTRERMLQILSAVDGWDGENAKALPKSLHDMSWSLIDKIDSLFTLALFLNYEGSIEIEVIGKGFIIIEEPDTFLFYNEESEDCLIFKHENDVIDHIKRGY